jgi:hypothetical protein
MKTTPPWNRRAEISRETSETAITVALGLDGEGRADIATGIGFLDHMLTALARHGLFDLKVRAKGDLHIDFHHTTEDVGIVIGPCLRQALGDPGGEGEGVGALAEAAEAFARRRARQEAALLDRLAAAAEIHPEAYAWLDPKALGADALGVAALARLIGLIGGAAWPVPLGAAAALGLALVLDHGEVGALVSSTLAAQVAAFLP